VGKGITKEAFRQLKGGEPCLVKGVLHPIYHSFSADDTLRIYIFIYNAEVLSVPAKAGPVVDPRKPDGGGPKPGALPPPQDNPPLGRLQEQDDDGYKPDPLERVKGLLPLKPADAPLIQRFPEPPRPSELEGWRLVAAIVAAGGAAVWLAWPSLVRGRKPPCR
jgi:hypothetical protein